MITLSAEVVPVLSGVNSHMRTGLKAKELGITKALVIYDEGVYKGGVVEPVLESLRACKIEIVTYDKVVPNPPDYQINECSDLAKAEGINGIIAVGGGSVMDSAKAVNVLCCNEGPINKFYFPSVIAGTPLPMIALPTTAGTGSEGSFAAVITDTTTNLKGALLDKNFCKFTLTISDPIMYAGLPARPSAYSAFDVLAHTIDGLMSTYNEPYANMFCETAIRKVVEYLPRVIANGKDLEARAEIAFAATIGGNNLNTNMAGCTHTIGHSVGMISHIPHGLAVAMPLPSLIMLHYWKHNIERVKLVGDCFGVKFEGNESPEEIGQIVGKAVFDFMIAVGVDRPCDVKVTEEEYVRACKLMVADIQTPTCFEQLSVSDYKAVIDHMRTL